MIWTIWRQMPGKDAHSAMRVAFHGLLQALNVTWALLSLLFLVSLAQLIFWTQFLCCKQLLTCPSFSFRLSTLDSHLLCTALTASHCTVSF